MPEPKAETKTRKPRTIKPAEYVVQEFDERNGVRAWVDIEIPTESEPVEDTTSGKAWIAAHGQPGKKYRVARVSQEWTIQE